MKPIKNHVWVEYPKTLRDEEKHGDLILYKDPSYKPEWNVIQYGKVVQINEGPNTHENIGIKSEVEIGDIIYFNYAIPDAGDEFHEENGTRYLRVPMWAIYCSIRNGGLIMIGGHILTKPAYDTDDVEEVDVDGKNITARVHNGLVIGLDIKHDKRLTKLAHIGNPLESKEELPVSPGDVIFMDRYCDIELLLVISDNIDDHYDQSKSEKFFVMKQENILGVYDPVH